MKKLDIVNAIKEVLAEKKRPGLWANIRAKKARGEKPAHKNSNAHKDAVKAGKKINKSETKGAPAGHYFTKSGNLVKGTMSADAKERGARKSDPKDKMRSKVPKATQFIEGLWANINAKKKAGKKSSHGNSNAYKDAKKAGNALKQENQDRSWSREDMETYTQETISGYLERYLGYNPGPADHSMYKMSHEQFAAYIAQEFIEGIDELLDEVDTTIEQIREVLEDIYEDYKKVAMGIGHDPDMHFEPEEEAIGRDALGMVLKTLDKMATPTKLETANPQDGKAAPYGSGYKKVKESMTRRDMVNAIREVLQDDSKEIVDDILSGINEGMLDGVLDKMKKYASKGFLTLAILSSVLQGLQAQGTQQTDLDAFKQQGIELVQQQKQQINKQFEKQNLKKVKKLLGRSFDKMNQLAQQTGTILVASKGNNLSVLKSMNQMTAKSHYTGSGVMADEKDQKVFKVKDGNFIVVSFYVITMNERTNPDAFSDNENLDIKN